MRIASSLLLLLATSFFCRAVPVQLINKPDPPAQNQSTVTGRVLMHGAGLAGATVVVWRWPSTEPQPEGTWKTQTDQRGVYRITTLAAGNYYIAASGEGFISTEKGQPANPKYFSITGGTVVTDIDFEMIRGGVVAGRVTNGQGEPVAQEPVRLIRVDALTLSPISLTVPTNNLTGRTDDRGTYRLSGVPPGRYRAATGWPCLAMSTIRGRPAYDRAFYPNVAEESKAKLIEVGEAKEISDVDITLGPKVDLFSISGRLVDDTGQAIPNLKYGLDILTDPKTPCGFSDAGSTNNRGEFKIEKIPAGRYSIRVPPALSPITAAPPAFFSEREPFDVPARDVTNVDVRLMRTATVSGVVVLEGIDDKAGLEKLSQLSIRVGSMKIGSSPSTQVFRVAPTGGFSVSGLRPGALYWVVTEPFLVKRIERSNVVQDQNIELKAGESLTDVRIILGYATASVSGNVKFVNGSPLPNTRVVIRLWPTIPTQSRMPVAATLVDPAGHFLMQNVPAGAYRVVVSAESDKVQGKTPMSQGNVVVPSSGVTQLSLTLDFASTP